MLLERLAECLAYREKYAPRYEAASLLAEIELPLQDVASWDDLLSHTPAALIHRGEALKRVARVLLNDLRDTPETTGTESERFFAVQQQLLGDIHVPPELSFAQQELNRPRALLIFDPAASLHDGTAQISSNGYLDYSSAPPWDTWLCALPPLAGDSGSSCLLCWVPEWAGSLVSAGMSVEPVPCLSWAEMQGDVAVSREWGLDWDIGD